MNVFVGYQSAVEFWRHYGSRYSGQPELLRATPPLGAAPDDTRVMQLLKTDLRDCSAPLHVIVAEAKSPRNESLVMCHRRAAALPSKSFHLAGEAVFVSSPELTFVQMASVLSLFELIQLGYELCGMYALAEDTFYEADDATLFQGFRYRNPVTSASKLAAFAERARGLRGVVPARRAAQYVLDNSASPRETALAMALTLPNALGGYGLPDPILNCRLDYGVKSVLFQGPCTLSMVADHYGVDVSGSQSNEFRICDLYWKDAKLDVEYDSDGHHLTPCKISKDASRRNELESRGVMVITVTSRQLSSWEETEKVARQIARRLGVHIRKKSCGLTDARRELRALLLDRG